MTPTLLLALTTLACSPGKTGGEHYFDDWACEYEPWGWYDDPVQAVLESDDDGDFDYDPPSELVTSRAGSYDFEDGDIGWSSGYLDGYFGVIGEVEGYGTVYDNGDVDLLYLSTFEDVLGEVSYTRIRAERQDCSATSKSWVVDAGDALETTPSDDPFEWTYEIVDDDRVEAHTEFTDSGEDWVYDRVFTSDMKTVTTFEMSSGDAYGETTAYGDGTATATQALLGDDIDYFYEIDSRLDGSRTIVNTGFYAGTSDQYSQCDYDLSYEGEGGGECSFEVEGDTWTCDITITTSDCELDCGSNGTYDC